MVRYLTQTQNKTETLALSNITNLHLGEIAAVAAAADRFRPISLDEMDSVKLMNRIDRKYVIRIEDLPEILASLSNDYRILTVEGARLNAYRTVYFDTEDFELYGQHVTKRKNRIKVRQREYVESNHKFLEVKRKTNGGRTVKTREEIETFTEMRLSADRRWFYMQLDGSWKRLEAKLWNNFTRITLVSLKDQERVTIDLSVTVSTPAGSVRFDEIAVVEVKTGDSGQNSLFAKKMKAYHYRTQSFSKYAVGVATLVNGVKKNAMKPIMLQLKKLTEGNY